MGGCAVASGVPRLCPDRLDLPDTPRTIGSIKGSASPACPASHLNCRDGRPFAALPGRLTQTLPWMQASSCQSSGRVAQSRWLWSWSPLPSTLCLISAIAKGCANIPGGRLPFLLLRDARSMSGPPRPLLAKLSRFWLVNVVRSGHRYRVVHELHQRYGEPGSAHANVLHPIDVGATRKDPS